MGDKSPKQKEKQAAQKQQKTHSASKQKGQALAAQQVTKNPKGGGR